MTCDRSCGSLFTEASRCLGNRQDGFRARSNRPGDWFWWARARVPDGLLPRAASPAPPLDDLPLPPTRQNAAPRYEETNRGSRRAGKKRVCIAFDWPRGSRLTACGEAVRLYRLRYLALERPQTGPFNEY